MYVNHSIGFKMNPEQVLYYSDNCFGTADALIYVQRSKTLRVFDLKTGETEASFDQLFVYAALFCLEYKFKPFDIEYDLRIYQNNEIFTIEVNKADIAFIMDKIQTFSKRLDEMRMEESV